IHTVGLALDTSGNLLIADSSFVQPQEGRVRLIANDLISSIAGGGDSTQDGIPATQARIPPFNDLVVDQAGTIYIGVSGLRRLTPSKDTVVNSNGPLVNSADAVVNSANL